MNIFSGLVMIVFLVATATSFILYSDVMNNKEKQVELKKKQLKILDEMGMKKFLTLQDYVDFARVNLSELKSMVSKNLFNKTKIRF